MDVSEMKERELFIGAGKRKKKKSTLDFGALLGSASTSLSRRKAPSMLIRRAATREGTPVENSPR